MFELYKKVFTNQLGNSIANVTLSFSDSNFTNVYDGYSAVFSDMTPKFSALLINFYKCRFDNLNSDSKYSQRNLTFFSLDGIFFIKTGIYNLIIANSHITRYARIVFLSGKETFLFYVYNTYFSWNYWSLYINNNWVSYKPVDILSGIAQK